MSSLLDYLAERGRLLAESYQADCLAIARDIARLLTDSGRRPFIVYLNRVEARGRDKFHYPLMPKKYGGRVTWTKHYVCCAAGMAYDPILEEPVPIEQYCAIVFGEDFPMERFVSEDKMDDYLNDSQNLNVK
jgi:hypothetical protein